LSVDAYRGREHYIPDSNWQRPFRRTVPAQPPASAIPVTGRPRSVTAGRFNTHARSPCIHSLWKIGAQGNKTSWRNVRSAGRIGPAPRGLGEALRRAADPAGHDARPQRHFAIGCDRDGPSWPALILSRCHNHRAKCDDPRPQLNWRVLASPGTGRRDPVALRDPVRSCRRGPAGPLTDHPRSEAFRFGNHHIARAD
jgi:hypothetical protein